MTTKISLWLGGLILAGIVLDLALLEGDNLVFLGQRGLELMEYIAFWR
ncbi:hypothetical protein [Algirhabdus cladophorae]